MFHQEMGKEVQESLREELSRFGMIGEETVGWMTRSRLTTETRVGSAS
jgi:hypothetical protein